MGARLSPGDLSGKQKYLAVARKIFMAVAALFPAPGGVLLASAATDLPRALVFSSMVVFGVPALAADLPATQSTQDLVQAAKDGDLNRVAGLLQAGADPNVVDADWNSPLIFAARDGRLEMVKVLVKAGALVNWQDGEKVTPLILAAFRNHEPVVRYLLAVGADPLINDQWQRRALDYALNRGKNDPIAHVLHRAEVNWPGKLK